MKRTLRTCYITIIISLLLINANLLFAQQPAVNKGPLDTSLPTNYIEAKRDPFRGEIKIVKEEIKTPPPITALPFPSYEERESEWRKQRANAQKNGQPAPLPAERYLIDELQIIGIYQKPEGKGVFLKPKNVPGTTIFATVGQKFFNGSLRGIEDKIIEFELQTKLSTNKIKSEKYEVRFSHK
jgi:hypothetical protein